MVKDIRKFPLHLGLGAKAVSEPEFNGPSWYADYDQRHSSDGKEGRLVAVHTFRESWKGWEMHPFGDEVVLCLSGCMTLIQECPNGLVETQLSANEYIINPAGVWHTADVSSEATALFITPGEGTEHRER